MAHAMVEHMKKNGVKTVGFLGYTDAYGELLAQGLHGRSPTQAGIKVVAAERFARTDTSVTGAGAEARRAPTPTRSSSSPRARGAAMPEKASSSAATRARSTRRTPRRRRDLMRIGGKDVEGTYVVSGPAVVAEQLPDSHPSKKRRDRLRARSTRRPTAPARATSSPATPTTSRSCCEKMRARSR